MEFTISRRAWVLMLLMCALGACGLTRRPEIVESVGRIDGSRLRADVEALCAIGPRPIEDAEATGRTVAWLHARCAEIGLAVTEEPVSYRPSVGVLVAQVRRPDADPASEPEELELPGYYRSYGARVLDAQSRRLREEGWDVLGYAGRGVGIAAPTGVAPNLIVEIPGRSGRPGVVELSAHYDTVPASPGADDDASGVAALLEIARVLTERPPDRTVRFCFFAGEESKKLGSAVHVANLLERGETMIGLYNLDAVGHATDAPDSQQAPARIPLVTWMPSTGDFVAVIGNWSSGPLGNLFEDAADAYVPELEYYSANRIGSSFDDGWRSDHAAYWKADLPAIFLTDTGNFRWDTYHTPDDVPADLDFVFLRRVTQATLAATLELARR